VKSYLKSGTFQLVVMWFGLHFSLKRLDSKLTRARESDLEYGGTQRRKGVKDEGDKEKHEHGHMARGGHGQSRHARHFYCLKRPYSGVAPPQDKQLAAVFYSLGHPTPYVSEDELNVTGHARI
jgi:hypothetical protein